ncbi:hypothetical protein, partial [Enterobacter cloacae complex sp. P24RS]|uniref:hypothetical protein n=1 Tax=Enterobacter cloacae complex sp. P24RS TaxID=2779568 RepID=UPI001D0BECB4
SEVKRRSADGSVGSPHVRVGNCQASIKETPYRKVRGFLLCAPENAGWRHRLTVPTIVKTILTMVPL